MPFTPFWDILCGDYARKGGGRKMVEQITLGDVILTRKPHPCGGNEWTVTRTGADIKIKCNTCGHVVMLDRERFLRQRKAVVRRGESADNQKTEAVK